MPRLQGQELQNYLQWKQQRQSAPSQGGGGLLGIAKSIARPFTNLGEDVINLGAISGQLAMGGESKQKVLRGDFDPVIGNKEEYMNRLENPELFLTRGTKTAAGIGAFAIPGGGGVLGTGTKGMLASGTASGALSGFGASEEGEELGGTLKGGVAGFGTAGALQVAGKGLKLGKGKFGGKGGTKANIGRGKFKKYDPTSEIDEITQFNDAISRKPPSGQNKLQASSIRGQYKNLGLTTKKGSLDFVGDVDQTINQLESAREFFNLPRNAKGISEIPSRVGALRDQALTNSGKRFRINVNDLTRPDMVDDIVRNAPKEITEDQAKMAINRKLMKSISPEDLKGLTPKEMMTLNFETNANALQSIKKNTADSYVKVIKGKRVSTDDLAAAQVHKWADKNLSTIPAYKKLNSTFSELFKANDGFRRAYDTGLRGTYIASPQAAGSQVAYKASNLANRGIEKLGDLSSGMRIAGKGKTPGKLTNLLGSQGMAQAGQIGQRLAPIAAAQQFAGGGGGGQFGQSPEDLGLEGISPQFGGGGQFGGLGSQGGGQLGQFGGGQGGGDLESKRRLLGMAVMSGEIGAGEAKFAAEMLGLGGQSGGKALPATQVAQMGDIQYAVEALGSMGEMISQKEGQFGALNISGRLRDLIGGPAADPEREAIKTQFDLFTANILKAYSGTGASDKERQTFKDMLPKLTDEPASSQAKIAAAKQELSNKLQTQQRMFQQAGYDPFAGAAGGGGSEYPSDFEQYAQNDLGMYQ